MIIMASARATYHNSAAMKAASNSLMQNSSLNFEGRRFVDLRNSTKGPRESEHSCRQPSYVNMRQNKPFEAEPACCRPSPKQSSRAATQALRSRARLLVTKPIKAEPTLSRPTPWPRSRACLQPTKPPPPPPPRRNKADQSPRRSTCARPSPSKQSLPSANQAPQTESRVHLQRIKNCCVGANLWLLKEKER